jgi:NTP pyrophosphatase (non-canonical NTP hydrolase)
VSGRVNEYDALLAQPETPERDGNEYDSILRSEEESRETSRRVAADVMSSIAPERQAKVLRLARQTGLPDDMVSRNLELVESEYRRASYDPKRLRRESPGLAGWLEHPDNAAVAHDDVESLSKLERLFGTWTRLPGVLRPAVPFQVRAGQVQEGFAAGQAQVRLGQALAARLGQDPDAIPGIAELRASAEREVDTEGLGFLGRSAVSTATILPGMLTGLTRGGGVSLAASGAAIAAAQPELVPFAAPAGFVAGGASATYDLETGLAYDEIVRQIRAMGLEPDFTKVGAFAAGIGTANAVIEMAPLSVFSKVAGIRKVTGRVRSAAISRLLSRPSVLRSLTGGVVSAAQQIGAETGAEGAQRAVTSLGREAAVGAAGGRTDFGAIPGEAASEMAAAVESFWLLALPGALGETGGGLRDTMRAKLDAQRAEQSAKTLDAIVVAAQDAKLPARLPESFEQLATRLAEQQGAPGAIYVTGGAWETLWQSANEDPAAKAEEILGQGGAAAYTEAKATGGDLAIPTGTYLARLREQHEALKSDLRTAPGELTVREAGKLSEQADKEIGEAVKAAEKAPETEAAQDPGEQIANAVAVQLQAAGTSADVAQRQATLVGAFFTTLGERTGQDPLALFQRQELSVGREESAPAPSLAQKVVALFQRREETPRGFIRFRSTETGRAFDIRLLPHADRSTFLHESAHFFLETYGDVAGDARAPEQIRSDFQTILAWQGLESRDKWTAEHHEKFAATFEQYLLEGKAPSKELAGVFARFAAWLRAIYDRAKGVVGSALTPEIRGVLDRMLATDEQIAAAETEQNYAPLFPTAKDAGVSEAEHAAYVEQTAAASEAARASLLKELTEEKKRELEPWWQEAKAATRKEVEAELAQDRVYRALHLLRKGEMLDGSEVPEVLAALKLSADGVRAIKGDGYSQIVRGIVSETGLDPDAAAEMLGFQSGEAMLSEFAAAEPYKKRVAAMVAERMKARYGDLTGDLPNAALAAVHSDRRAGVLFKELRFLARRLGVAMNLDPAQLQATADRIVAGRKVRELAVAPQQYRFAELRAAKRAGEAVAKGDHAQAYLAKQEQLFSFYLWRAATEARETKAKADRLFRRMAAAPSQERIAKAGEGYRDQINRLLRRFGIPVPQTQPGETFPAWLLQRSLAGESLEVADWLQDEARTAPVDQLTNAELADLVGAVRNLSALASDANRVRLENEKIERVAVIAQIEQEAARNKDLGPEPASATAAPGSWQRRQTRKAILAAMTDPEEIFRRLGAYAHRFFWGEYLRAREVEDRIAGKVLAFFDKAWSALPEGMRERRYELVDLGADLPLPPQLNLDASKRDRSWLWMVALNVGNESNMDRLAGGFGWDPAEVMRVLNERLTAEEWTFVQSVWNLIETELWPELAAKEQRKSGLPLEKIPASKVVTPHGTLRGGYFPAAYDRRASLLGLRQAEQQQQRAGSAAYLRPSTYKSHTKKRAERYTDVLDLNWHVVPSHVASVVHDIAFDEYLRDMGRVFFDRSFQGIVVSRLGRPYLDQIDGFLRYVQSSQADSVPRAVAGLMRPLVGLRSRFVIASLGWSFTVAAGDLTNPFVAVADGDVKASAMTPALLRTLYGFRSMRSEALSKSRVLQNRSNRFMARIRQELGQVGEIGQGDGILEGVRQTAWFLMDMTDRLTSTITWEGAYRDAIADGKAEAAAVAHADTIVRRHFPSPDIAEQPAILRDKRGMGALLVFFGYASKLGNIIGRDWYETGVVLRDEQAGYGDKASAVAKSVARFWAVMFVSNVLAEFLMGRGPDEDEGYPEWLLRKLLTGPFYLFPFIGGGLEIAANRLVFGHFKYTSPRQAPATAAAQRVFDAVAKAADSEQDADARVWAVLETIGLGAKLPVAQPSRTGRYLTDLATGEAEPRNPADVLSGLIYGERDRQAANPVSETADALAGEE